MTFFYPIILCVFAALTLGQSAGALDLDEGPTTGGLAISGWPVGVSVQSDVHYYVALYGSAAFDPQTPTHVLVTGHGESAGTLFQNSATTRAKRYAEIFPADQILLVSVNELDGKANAHKLQAWGYQILHKRKFMLSVSSLMAELRDLQQIASLDVYAHSNDVNGAALDQDFLGPHSYDAQELKDKFMPHAWASIHGCNSGWNLAPFLADIWGVPVSGSLTATHFERLHSTGDFYPYDNSLAPAGPWAPTNALSFATPQDCALAGCVRMHPDPYAYWGEWGKYKFGLGFYKFFCGSLTSEDCETAMATSLLGYPGQVDLKVDSGADIFLAVVKEFMCPINSAAPVRAECSAGIDNALASGDETYTPFLSGSLVCDATSCQEPAAGEVSREFMRAVKSLLRGWGHRSAAAAKKAGGPGSLRPLLSPR